MNYLIHSITEHFKNHPFDINQVDIIPYANVSSPMKGQTAWNKGLSLSQETKEKISKANKGKIQPESQRKAASKVLKEVNKILYICINCGKENNLGNHKRWHGENCGIKHHHSKETKQKIVNSSVGRKISENCRKAIIESNKKRKGKKYPDGYKTKKKVSDFS